ncbi:MAG: hypothetical protein ACOYMB_00260 [Patescibacteria group bacterium]
MAKKQETIKKEKHLGILISSYQQNFLGEAVLTLLTPQDIGNLIPFIKNRYLEKGESLKRLNANKLQLDNLSAQQHQEEIQKVITSGLEEEEKELGEILKILEKRQKEKNSQKKKKKKITL